jgi:hypothetical protein
VRVFGGLLAAGLEAQRPQLFLLLALLLLDDPLLPVRVLLSLLTTEATIRFNIS